MISEEARVNQVVVRKTPHFYILHPEDAKLRLLRWRVEGSAEAEAEHVAGVRGVDDAVVPEPRRCVVRCGVSKRCEGEQRVRL